MTGTNIVFVGNPEALSLGRNYIEPWTAMDVVVLLLLTPLCAWGVLVLDELSAAKIGSDWARGYSAPVADRRRFVAARAGLMLLAWLPYQLAYFPGGLPWDSLASLSQGPGSWDAANPLGFTIVAKLFLGFGTVLGWPNLGLFAYALVQSLAMATLLAYGVLLLAERGAPKAWCIATVAFFALAPAFPMFAITMLKDVPFSLVIVALTYYALAVVETDGALLSTARGIGVFLALAALAIAFRNNGIYVVAFVVLALAAAYRTRAVRVGLASAVLVVAVMLLQGPGYRLLGVGNERAVTESVGIPLQQTAYVIAIRGDIAADEQAFLNRLLPWDSWGQLYMPSIVDPIKASPSLDRTFLDKNLARFLGTWSRIVVRNPRLAAEAYAMQTFGYWKIADDHKYWVPYLEPNDLGLYQLDVIAWATGYPIWRLLLVVWNHEPGGGGSFPGEGLFAWLMLTPLAVLGLRRRWVWMLVVAPCLGVWLTIMVAAPVAYGLRFVLSLAMCAPGLVLLPFLPATRSNESGVV